MIKISPLSRIVGFIHTFSPFSRRRMWRMSYNLLNKKFESKEFRFLNYGYSPSVGEKIAMLQVEDEVDREFISLYHHVVADIDLENKAVVEIGSGRGGGSYYISRYMKPKTYTGVDFSRNAVQYCQKNYNVEGLSFMQGDAEHLPLLTETSDVVINVESSHCYGSMEKFVKEAFRILKPQGFFAWTDFRDPKEEKPLRELFQKSGFTIIKEEEITANVLESLDRTHDRKTQAIHKYTSPIMKSTMEDFAATKNSVMYEFFRAGELKYLHFLMQKQ